jgi:hypothetical protein
MKSKRHKLKIAENKNETDSDIQSVLTNIIRIEPKIHHIKLSCREPIEEIAFSADDFENEIKNYWVKKIKKFHEKGSSFNLLNRKINFYYNYKFGITNTTKADKNFPNVIFELSYPTPHLLLFLLEKYKKLYISSVEYTIDFYCRDPIATRKLYFLLKKYLFIENIRVQKIVTKNKIRKKYPNIKIIEDDPNFNYSYYLKYRALKLYERGPDNEDDFWEYNNIDRVRFELTDNGYYLMKLFKVKLLDKFIIDCKFNELMKDKISFRKFKKSKRRFPHEHEDYKIGKKPEYHNCIMYYKQRKGIGLENLIDANEFDHLKAQINDEMSKFTDDWKKEASDFKNIMKKGRL